MKAKVLLADDHALLRGGLRSLLEEEDDLTVVGEACDISEAEALLQSLQPNLAVVDVMLPGVNGLDILRRIRATGDMPVIMLTARAEESDRVAGLELGESQRAGRVPGRPARVTAVAVAALR